jgi:hypothetical protein
LIEMADKDCSLASEIFIFGASMNLKRRGLMAWVEPGQPPHLFSIVAGC